MRLKVKQSFDWAHYGVNVKSYAEGETINTDSPEFDQDLMAVALKEGWVVEAQVKSASPENKAHKTNLVDKVKT